MVSLVYESRQVRRDKRLGDKKWTVRGKTVQRSRTVSPGPRIQEVKKKKKEKWKKKVKEKKKMHANHQSISTTTET